MHVYYFTVSVHQEARYRLAGSQDCNPGVGLGGSLLRGSTGERDVAKLPQIVSRIHSPEALGLRDVLSCWLLPGAHPQLLEASHKVPCHVGFPNPITDFIKAKKGESLLQDESQISMNHIPSPLPYSLG